MLLDGYITDEELWACTSCRACVQECPVSIDQLSVILEMRRNLVLGETARANSLPSLAIRNNDLRCTHGATVGRLDENQVFYLRSRGLSEAEATLLIVNGFIEPFTKELPMEYAVELNRLLELEMEGSVG